MMKFKYDSVNHEQQDALDIYNRYKLAGEDLVNDVIRVASAPISNSSYSALPFTGISTADLAVKTSAGSLMSLMATNLNAAIRYVQIHNKASAISGGDTAIMSFPLPAGSATAPSTLILDSDFFGPNGLYLSAGIRIGFSTAGSTYTAATAADHSANGMYI